MKQRIFLKKKSKKPRTFIVFLICILLIYTSFTILDKSKTKITDKELVTKLLEQSGIVKSSNSLEKLKNLLKKLSVSPDKLLITTTSNLVDKKEKNIVVEKPTITTVKKPPLIYIYNSHQTEEYAASTFLEYNVNPTVMMADYILEEVFGNNNYNALVEEASIKEILNKNNWKYSYSYMASRTLMEQRKNEYPSLKYFIDVHRDSLTKDKTTIEINGKPYAKVLFIVGLENPNYEGNLNFTTAINNLLNEKYPNISKGIYKKSGPGVNGVYNQDFSPYTILIEMGGYENTTTEVMNATLAFAECFMEVISSYENKASS